MVDLCQEAGLVWGQELFFDATRVRANADVKSVVPRLGRVVGDHLEALFPEGTDASDGAAAVDSGAACPAGGRRPAAPAAGPAPAPPAPRRAPRRVLEAPAVGPAGAGPPRPWPTAGGGLPAPVGRLVSRTDPDATLMTTAAGGRAVWATRRTTWSTAGEARIILHALSPRRT